MPQTFDLERKGLRLELKADAEGSFRAVFATFDVIDHDGDVTRPGAFKDGTEVIIGAYGHNTRELPIGKGVIRTDQQEAAVDGEFFLDVPHAQQSYQTIKAIGSLQEWSYIFMPTKVSFGQFEGQQVRFLEGIDVFSVDPVLAGAGIDTRTTAIKGLMLPFVEHCERFEELLAEFAKRVKERSAVREKEGRTLSAANVERLSSIAESLKAASADLEKLRADASPKDNQELMTLRLQWLKQQTDETRAALGVA